MTPLFIQLAQSVTGAVITIVALLLVAAFIGCLTAWFYAKSVYTPVIKSLESDKTELNNQVTGLINEKDKLKGKVDKMNEKIVKLEEQIAEKEKELKSRKKAQK